LYLCSFLAAGGIGTANAQTAPMGAATPLPLGLDLKKVAIGSWSEYRIADGQNTISIRLALAARSAAAADIETQIKGGPIAALGRTTVRMSLLLDDSAEIKSREQVIQFGDNPPMLLPANLAGAQAQPFRKLDPQKRVGTDAITVPAGTFPHADHYRDKGLHGETVDFWISKDVSPFGLVKVATTSSGSGAGATSIAMELTGRGRGQKRTITKAPVPFDPAVIMKQVQPAMAAAGAGGGAGPPPLPIPSPHPGMPPTTGAAPPLVRTGGPSSANNNLGPAHGSGPKKPPLK
jgi:hypothetical protein